MIKEFSNKTVYYKDDGETIHREDGPAVIFKKGDGNVIYYHNGLIHNESGPARIVDGKSYYYFYGKLYDEITNNNAWRELVIQLNLDMMLK